MKFLLATLISLFSLVSTTSHASDEVNVSSAVISSFQASFKNASEVTWKVTGNYFKANFVLNEQYVSAFYGETGNLVAVTRNISSFQLPITLQTKLKDAYSNYWISDLFELSDDNGTSYYVTVEDGGNLIQKDGSVLSYTGAFKALKNGTSEVNKYAFWSSPVVNQNLTNMYTAGTSANQSDIIGNITEPIYISGRGGKYTYHGPGQRIIYLMLNLKLRYDHLDLRQYINTLEQWVITTLESIGIESFRRADRIGIWVNNNGEKKIAAIGVRVRKYVAYHGIAININPNLRYYDKIVACGIKDYGITSIEDFGYDCKVNMIDKILRDNFYKIFK
ncbi:MAG: lipoyl(octanoyl) transferase [Rickettsiales bacterium]|nr:MAG: lipoyl(octanoyl) transferase [Rickettsiales bacterium]